MSTGGAISITRHACQSGDSEAEIRVVEVIGLPPVILVMSPGAGTALLRKLSFLSIFTGFWSQYGTRALLKRNEISILFC